MPVLLGAGMVRASLSYWLIQGTKQRTQGPGHVGKAYNRVKAFSPFSGKRVVSVFLGPYKRASF